MVTWLLIGMNVWAFLNELLLGPELQTFVETWGFVPARYFALSELYPENWVARYVPIFTSMFLHGGWLHVLGNLWTLLIFGDNVEDRMGKGRFLAFYLLCGILAGATHVYFNRHSTVPTIGASGAIAGVMGAYFLLFPRARVITLIPLLFYPLFVELPAFVFLGLWFVSQILSSTLSIAEPGDAAGIAFQAHVGGFVGGCLLHRLFLRREP